MEHYCGEKTTNNTRDRCSPERIRQVEKSLLLTRTIETFPFEVCFGRGTSHRHCRMSGNKRKTFLRSLYTSCGIIHGDRTFFTKTCRKTKHPTCGQIDKSLFKHSPLFRRQRCFLMSILVFFCKPSIHHGVFFNESTRPIATGFLKISSRTLNLGTRST